MIKDEDHLVVDTQLEHFKLSVYVTDEGRMGASIQTRGQLRYHLSGPECIHLGEILISTGKKIQVAQGIEPAEEK